jgi:hypothetical protein
MSPLLALTPTDRARNRFVSVINFSFVQRVCVHPEYQPRFLHLKTALVETGQRRWLVHPDH